MPAHNDAHFDILPPNEALASIRIERGNLEYRPTVMVVAHTALGGILMVQSPNEMDGVSWLLQGGVEPNEDADPKMAVEREVYEEVMGIRVDSVGEYLGGFRSDIPRPRGDFTRGKVYLVYPACITQTEPVKPVPSQTNAARLVSFDQFRVQMFFNGGLEDRRRHKAFCTEHFVRLALGLGSG